MKLGCFSGVVRVGWDMISHHDAPPYENQNSPSRLTLLRPTLHFTAVLGHKKGCVCVCKNQNVDSHNAQT